MGRWGGGGGWVEIGREKESADEKQIKKSSEVNECLDSICKY